MPEPMEGAGNPDAGQDRALIQAVIQQELSPIFEVIASRFKDLDEDLGEARDLLFKFAQGLISTADDHKRGVLTSELTNKYGKDFEPLDGFYKDTMGKGFTDSIIEELMAGEYDEAGRDEFVKGKLGEARGKYGKYLGMGAEPTQPAVAEVGISHEAAESPEKEAAEESADDGRDSVERLMYQVSNLGGKKHSFSGQKKR